MAEFTPIETQEQFDAAIKERLERENKKYEGYLAPDAVESKYKGYLAPDEVEEKYKDYMSKEDVERKYKDYLSPEETAKKDAALKKYESDSVKTRIAKEAGLSAEAAEFLHGDSEDELKKSAEALKKLTKHSAPLRNNDTRGEDKDEALRNTLRKLNVKGE